MKTKNLDTFFIYLTAKEEICNVIPSLNPNKSTGPFSIRLKILKLLKKGISSQLNDIFNLSVATGVFPTSLQTAIVIHVHKKQSKFDFCNYRPILLLSNLEKIFVKLMHNRLTDLLEKNNIYPLPFGFRKNCSTAYALIHLTNLISESHDSGKFVFGISVISRRHLTLLIIKFYLINLNIMAYKVLLINSLKLIYVIVNNMCQLMVLNLTHQH